MDYQVTNVTMSASGSRHEHITQIGGNGWILSRQDAVRRIASKVDRFYVIDPRNWKTAFVGIWPVNGVQYLRTHADGDWNDNLLSLPRRTSTILTG